MGAHHHAALRVTVGGAGDHVPRLAPVCGGEGRPQANDGLALLVELVELPPDLESGADDGDVYVVALANGAQ